MSERRPLKFDATKVATEYGLEMPSADVGEQAIQQAKSAELHRQDLAELLHRDNDAWAMDDFVGVRPVFERWREYEFRLAQSATAPATGGIVGGVLGAAAYGFFGIRRGGDFNFWQAASWAGFGAGVGVGAGIAYQRLAKPRTYMPTEIPHVALLAVLESLNVTEKPTAGRLRAIEDSWQRRASAHNEDQRGRDASRPSVASLASAGSKLRRWIP